MHHDIVAAAIEHDLHAETTGPTVLDNLPTHKALVAANFRIASAADRHANRNFDQAAGARILHVQNQLNRLARVKTLATLVVTIADAGGAALGRTGWSTTGGDSHRRSGCCWCGRIGRLNPANELGFGRRTER